MPVGYGFTLSSMFVLFFRRPLDAIIDLWVMLALETKDYRGTSRSVIQWGVSLPSFCSCSAFNSCDSTSFEEDEFDSSYRVCIYFQGRRSTHQSRCVSVRVILSSRELTKRFSLIFFFEKLLYTNSIRKFPVVVVRQTEKRHLLLGRSNWRYGEGKSNCHVQDRKYKNTRRFHAQDPKSRRIQIQHPSVP